MIANGDVFGRTQKVILRLLDIAPMMGVLEGVVMELSDCAFNLVQEVIPTADPAVAFKVIYQKKIFKFFLNSFITNRMSQLHFWSVPCLEEKEWKEKTCYLLMSRSSKFKVKL